MPFRSLHAPDKKAVSFVYSVPFVFVSLVSFVDHFSTQSSQDIVVTI